jgi:hypothetical protein
LVLTAFIINPRAAGPPPIMSTSTDLDPTNIYYSLALGGSGAFAYGFNVD